MSESEVSQLQTRLIQFACDPFKNDVAIKRLLESLSSFTITVDILQKTKIGLTLHSIKKKLSRENQTLVKKLVKKWKTIALRYKDLNQNLQKKTEKSHSKKKKIIRKNIRKIIRKITRRIPKK